MLINKMRELLVYKLLVLTTISNLTKIVTAYSVLNKMNTELEQQFSKAPFPVACSIYTITGLAWNGPAIYTIRFH